MFPCLDVLDDTPEELERCRKEVEQLCSGTFGDSGFLLHTLLPLAVANLVECVRNEDWPARLARIARIRQRWADRGYEGFSEAIMCRTEPGESKADFCDLAELVAVGAFVPGGIRCFGWHWKERD